MKSKLLEQVNSKYSKCDSSQLKIIDYLIKSEYELENLMNPTKNAKDMIGYVNKKAKSKANGSNTIMIDDETVYSWAMHYFDETNEFLENEKVDNTKTENEKQVDISVNDNVQISLGDLYHD